MAFTEIESARIEGAMSDFIEKRRPPESIRAKFDVSYRIEGQSVVIFELRPFWRDPSKIIEGPVAKATYVRGIMDAVKRLFGVSIGSKSAQSQAIFKVIFLRSRIPPQVSASSVSDATARNCFSRLVRMRGERAVRRAGEKGLMEHGHRDHHVQFVVLEPRKTGGGDP